MCDNRDRQTLKSILDDIVRMGQELDSSPFPHAISKRGYCLPDEDAWIKRSFATYLRHRTAVYDLINRYRDYENKPLDEVADAFIIGFAAATLLFCWSSVIVGNYKDNAPVRAKLNEGDLGFGIEPDSFDLIFRNLTRVENQNSLASAAHFYETHRLELEQAVHGDAVWLFQHIDENLKNLKRDPFDIWVSRLLRDLDVSLKRPAKPFKEFLYRAQARLFDIFGNIWFDHLPQIPENHCSRFLELARPGDFFIVRPDRKSSTVFLPGWWTHAALFVGGGDGLRTLGADTAPNAGRVLKDLNRLNSEEPLVIMEALSAGVVLNSLSHSLQVDHAVLIRPTLSQNEIIAGLNDAFAHYGKPYDFEFDFTRSDRLVCTELIYRGFHGKGRLQFEPTLRLGRPTLSADDLITTVLREQSSPAAALSVIAISYFNATTKTNEFYEESAALDQLKRTMTACPQPTD